ncbi:MAG: bile acid:sodium symporter family protein [Lautropia sp.]|nr:MAG: bile acid:sodium symporter family protein [Pseudomonadota bacterium]MBC6959902.1 bile acid:sodium symporter family protein [Lautropia sp.]MCL4702073.1 bile acid:sodium symporter family protein [Burkholderiaceae bacterium]MCZ2415335.1 bile acid:sodium symporter family protein [Burkholderiales bacterium]MDL1908449.1 bile acid:sodium symporter family protein [Betaproteobacteria bacterium PRO1]
MSEIDLVRLNFSPEALGVLNVILALVLFGVALDMRVSDFRGVAAAPRATLIGMLGQFLLLPAVGWAIGMVLKPAPSIALGLILVAACPGGNISNFLTHFARGNTALSITMTSISTLASLVFTPLNLTVWGSLNPDTARILTAVNLNPLDVLVTIVFLLGIPAALGMGVAHWFPKAAARAQRPAKILSLLFFGVFVVGALAGNWAYFIDYVGRVVLVVFLMNGLGLLVGYWIGRLARLSEADCRATSIEVGIQNSGFGLILVFNFFGGMGGMAIVAAWWGIWHVLTGLALATWWRRRPPPVPAR